MHASLMWLAGRLRSTTLSLCTCSSMIRLPPPYTSLQTKSAAELAEDEDDEEEEEEEEPEGKWYYLGGNSVGELILNIIALGIAGVMLFNFLYSRGLWQKYVQPIFEWVLLVLWPVLSVVGNKLLPWWMWFTVNVYDFRWHSRTGPPRPACITALCLQFDRSHPYAVVECHCRIPFPTRPALCVATGT